MSNVGFSQKLALGLVASAVLIVVIGAPLTGLSFEAYWQMQNTRPLWLPLFLLVGVCAARVLIGPVVQRLTDRSTDDLWQDWREVPAEVPSTRPAPPTERSHERRHLSARRLDWTNKTPLRSRRYPPPRYRRRI